MLKATEFRTAAEIDDANMVAARLKNVVSDLGEMRAAKKNAIA